MKILIVTPGFPPTKDGVSEAASTMARGFLNLGWQVSVLTAATMPPRESLSWQGADLAEFGYGGTYHQPTILMQDPLHDFASFLVGGRWDAVIFHTYQTPLIRALPILQRVPGRKILVSHGHGALHWNRHPRFPYGLASLCRRFLSSLAMIIWMRRFDRIVYLSEQADFEDFFDHLIAKVTGYKGRRVIPNGIDLDERGDPNSRFRREHAIPTDAFLLLCVANYCPRKDQAYGARAFRKAAIPGSVLVFIGSELNEHSRRFQEEDREATTLSAPGRIIWLEKQSRASTLDAFAACDVFLLSAYQEAQPIALLEAMRESKPWVARKAGCIARMEGGICVTSQNEMANAISRLATDREMRTRLGTAGANAIAERYSRQAYETAYRCLVEEAVATDACAVTDNTEDVK